MLPHEPWIPQAIASIGEAILQRRLSFQDVSKAGMLNYDDFAKCTRALVGFIDALDPQG